MSQIPESSGINCTASKEDSEGTDCTPRDDTELRGASLGAQKRASPFGISEVFQGRVDIVGEIPFRLPEILDLRRIALDSGFED